MPDFTVRAISPEDREGFGHIRSRVYRGGDPVLPDERILRDDSHGFVVASGETIVGAATVLSMTCSRNGNLHPCAGIAAVGVVPEWRGTGAGSALMIGLTTLLREMGFEVASLHPFRDTWYRRFGYASIGTRFQIECPAEHLPKVQSNLAVREVKSSEWHVLAPVVEANAATYNGFNIRSADQWWRTLGGDKPHTLYVAGDPVEAYCIVKLDSDFWVPQEIKEVLWSTRDGHAAMMGLFRQLGFNKKSLSWAEPGDSITLRDYYDRGAMTVSMKPPLMYRLLSNDDPSVAHSATQAWLGDPHRVFCADQF